MSDKIREYAKKYYLENRERILAQKKRRYQEDETYRATTRSRARNRYRVDATYREKTRARAKARYHQDESYRMATIQRAKQRYQRRKRQTTHSETESSKQQNKPSCPESR